MGNAMEEAKSYTAGIDAVIVDHRNFTHVDVYMHSGTGKQAQGLWRGVAWWRDMTDHRASVPLHSWDEFLTEQSMKTRRHGTHTSCKQQNASTVVRRWQQEN